jgi:beta-phosphoglucomutase-like phosphatase (HAD superfamily)
MTDTQIAILWDMDGTLLDTTDMHLTSWVNTLAHHGLAINKSDALAHYGKNNRAIILNYFPRATEAFIEDISTEKEKEFCKSVSGNTYLYPGVMHWLEVFRANGYQQSIASSAPMGNIDILLAETNIRHFFNHIASGADIPGKPDPRLFLSVAHHLKISTQACLVIEDAPAGVEAALRAHMHCIAITNSHPADDLNGANLIINAFTPDTLQQAEKLLPH